MEPVDIRAHNRQAWNQNVEHGSIYTLPVTPEEIAAARQGNFQIFLTDRRPVPREWLPQSMAGVDVLGLASGGGQQGPLLAAAGARVTIFDNSPAQLAQDQKVAARENLEIRLVEGDMRDLSAFGDASFDLVIHPISNVFCPEPEPVWREAYRVLRPDGVLLAGFMNPDVFIFDLDLLDTAGKLKVRHPLPYADIEHLSPAKRKRYLEQKLAFEWSHSMETQIGGQLAAGFLISGFFEDRNRPELRDPISAYLPNYYATRALKPG